MSEVSTDHGVDEFAALPGRHAKTHVEWNERQADLAAGNVTKQTSSRNQRVKKILFANKFFFLNGGSEVVMFDEMELMKKNDLDVIEFSMNDARNFPSKYESYFVAQKGYRSNSRVQSDQVRTFTHSFA